MHSRREVLTFLSLSILSRTAQGANLANGFVAVHQSEPLLLHKQISASLLAKLEVWDFRLSQWNKPQPETAVSDGSPAYVLHLWADYCAPCREEFPILRELVEETDKKYGGKLRWVFLCETDSAEAVQAFLEKYRARMPKGPQYLDSGEGIANVLREGLTSALAYPVTLLLDSQRIVRHAFVGRIRGRRAEFMTALDRLLSIPR